MNKPTIILAGVLLCAGCNNKSYDGTAIDAMSRKLETVLQEQSTICSNQAAIFDQLRAIQSDTGKLPDTRAIDSMLYFYHTNEIDAVSCGILGSGQITLTNLYRLEAGQVDMQLSLFAADSRVGSTEYILTNNLADFLYIREKVDDMGNDIRRLKARLDVP
jgi:hypothetical protein